MRRILRHENLTFLGALIGLAAGWFLPSFSINVSFIGDLFILLLKMIIVPLIFVSVFLAIARQESVTDLSKLGSKTFIYFLLTSTLACMTGMATSFLLPAGIQGAIGYTNYDSSNFESLTFTRLFLSFFSSNPFKSLAQGDIIQIVVISLLVGMASIHIEKTRRESLLNIMEAVHDVVMVLIKWIIFIAPIGVFSLVASVVAKTDKSAFAGLGWLFVAITVAMGVHSLITLPILGLSLGRFNPYRFIFNVKEALLVALATASSSATLPVSTRVLEEKENVSKKTAGFVLPLGATINMDGSSLYQTLVVLFLAGLAGIEVTFTQQLYIFFLILISSVGTAGIPGGGLLMLGAILQNVGIPLEYLGIYLLVDRVWDPPTTMINVLGDLFGAKIIHKFQR